MPTNGYEITPIGAAYVEALPNRKRAKEIQRLFEDSKICPASAVFTEAQVVAYYKERGQRVAAYSAGVKALTSAIRAANPSH